MMTRRFLASRGGFAGITIALGLALSPEASPYPYGAEARSDYGFHYEAVCASGSCTEQQMSEAKRVAEQLNRSAEQSMKDLDEQLERLRSMLGTFKLDGVSQPAPFGGTSTTVELANQPSYD